MSRGRRRSVTGVSGAIQAARRIRRDDTASSFWASMAPKEDDGIQRTTTKKRKTPKSLEYLHDEQRTLRVGGLPRKHCEVSAVTDLFSEYGKVASVTVRKRPRRESIVKATGISCLKHDNWALVSFFNVRCVAEAVEAGKEGTTPCIIYLSRICFS